MKKFFIIFVALMLVACRNKTPETTEVPTLIHTETPTATPMPTSTSQPTPTATPHLPDTIEITFDSTITVHDQEQVKIVINKTYWYFVSIGCSPEGFRAKFYTGEGGYADYDNNGAKLEAGVDNISSASSNSSHAISHEMAHVMCQLQFTRKGNMGAIDLRWLTEGFANYLTEGARINNTGDIYLWSMKKVEEFGIPFLCKVPPSLLENSKAHEEYPSEYPQVSMMATELLVKTAPNGIESVINYYKLLNNRNAYEAFEESFGITTKEFYQRYDDECINYFPSTR